MASGVTVTKDRTKQVMAILKQLTREQVLVGIPSEKAERQPEPGEKSAPLNNAEVGYLSEFGSPEANIPPRPHLVPGAQRVTKQFTEIYRKGLAKALDGDASAIHAAHVQVGTIVTSSIKTMIDEGLSPPLAPSTLAERARRGVTRTDPLRDTGQYRNNIDFVIRPAKSGNSGNV